MFSWPKVCRENAPHTITTTTTGLNWWLQIKWTDAFRLFSDPTNQMSRHKLRLVRPINNFLLLTSCSKPVLFTQRCSSAHTVRNKLLYEILMPSYQLPYSLGILCLVTTLCKHQRWLCWKIPGNPEAWFELRQISQTIICSQQCTDIALQHQNSSFTSVLTS